MLALRHAVGLIATPKFEFGHAFSSQSLDGYSQCRRFGVMLRRRSAGRDILVGLLLAVQPTAHAHLQANSHRGPRPRDRSVRHPRLHGPGPNMGLRGGHWRGRPQRQTQVTGRQGELDRYRTPKGRQNKRGPIVTFEHFVCFDSDEPNVPDFENWRLCSPGESLGMCEQS